MSYVDVFFKLFLTLVLLLLYLKASNNSQLTPMTASDQIGSIVMGALAGGAIAAEVSTPMLIAVIGIWGALLLGIRALKYRSTWFSALLDGERIQLMRRGRLIIGNFNKTKITPEDFMMGLHQKDVNSLNDLRNVWLESSGDLTIDRVGDDLLSKVIISNGQIVENSLEDIHKEKEWLMQQLDREQKYEIKDVFLAEWHDGRLWVYPFADEISS